MHILYILYIYNAITIYDIRKCFQIVMKGYKQFESHLLLCIVYDR